MFSLTWVKSLIIRHVSYKKKKRFVMIFTDTKDKD